jgi:uncharacterized protein YigE (DUF2233 family)
VTLRRAARRTAGFAAIGIVAFAAAVRAEAVRWRQLERGLELAELAAPLKSPAGDSIITVLRVDPARFALKLVTVSEFGGDSKPAHDWARQFGFLAATNAGLYQADHRTAVGLMRNGRHINNPGFKRSYNTVLAFNPRSARVPPVQIIDTRCQNFRRIARRYATLIQSIRMIGCRGRVVWKQDTRRWSIAAVAMDRRQRVLFTFTRSPYTVHDFATMLRRLPLRVRGAMYLEGGPPATLFVDAGGVRFEKVGSHGSSTFEGFENASARPLPFVIGVVRRGRSGRR